MENFARHHYENNVDQLVREELKQAGIPILELPCYMDTEVKPDMLAFCMVSFFTVHGRTGFVREICHWILLNRYIGITKGYGYVRVAIVETFHRKPYL